MPSRHGTPHLLLLASVVTAAACGASSSQTDAAAPRDFSTVDARQTLLDLTETTPVDQSGTTPIDQSGTTPADQSGAATDGGGASALRVEEIYVDRDLSGDKVEFVEIAGLPGTSLDGVALRLLGASGNVRYEVALSSTTGAVMPSGGRWTVGGSSVFDIASPSKIDQTYSISNWGLDNSAGAVQLVVATTRELLDVVAYGAQVPQPTSDPRQSVEGSYTPVAANARGESLGRIAPDTGNNSADFCRMTATPGYPNGPCL